MKISFLENDKFSWLKKSYFYENLDLNDEDELEVPYCSKYTTNIDLYIDVTHFWGMKSYPNEFYDLLLEKNPINKLQFMFDLTKSKFYKFLLNVLKNKKNLPDKAAKNGFLDFLIYCHLNNYEITEKTFLNAIEYGYLDCIVFLFTNLRNKIHINLEGGLTEKAAECGHLNILKFLREGLNKNLKWIPCQWDFLACWVASREGNLKCLKYAYENMYIDDRMRQSSILEVAANNGQLHCVKYLLSKFSFYSREYIISAARSGNLICLKYLHNYFINDIDMNKFFGEFSPIFSAVKSGNLSVLKFLHESGYLLSQYAFIYACELGNLEFVEYMYENGCIILYQCMYAAVKSNSLSIVNFFYEKGFYGNKVAIKEASKHQDLDIFKFLHENGCDYDKKDLLKTSRKDVRKYVEKYM